ncbi:hypothetical protein GQ457_12G025940 [Hibiscus cannabinus]
MQLSNTLCAFCLLEPETTSHLFCHCSVSWRIWNTWCRLWKVSLVFPANVRSMLLMWQQCSKSMINEHVWLLSFFSFVYSIWLYRNEAIFKGAKIDVNHFFDQGVLRLSWWCKALWPDVTPAFSDIVASPLRIGYVQPRTKILEAHGWIAPEKGSVKFNTDGAVEGSYGEAGIGGCLRDENSKTLLYFSMSVGVNNVVSTKMLAIKEALKLYNSLKGSHSSTIVIESDNQSVVGWLQHPHLAPANIKEEF